ncbi:hypothetical protein ACOME3_004236 [Neoechinorhynchus agilis]
MATGGESTVPVVSVDTSDLGGLCEAISKIERDRKERKEQLKRLYSQGESNLEVDNERKGNRDQQVVPIFRSYVPSDEHLKETTIPGPNLTDFEKIVKKSMSVVSEDVIQNRPVNAFLIAPERIDADLKKDIENDMQKLKQETMRAMTEIARENILNRKYVSAIADTTS